MSKITFFLGAEADGGVVRGTLILAGKFAENGHGVDVVTVNKHASMLDSPPLDVHVVDLHSRRALFAIPKLASHLRRSRSDVVISAQHYANLATIAAARLSRRRPNVIITERVEIESALAMIGGAKRRVLSRLIKMGYGRANSVVANSRASADALAEFLGWDATRVHSIYNPTYNPRVQYLAAKYISHAWFRGERNLRDGPLVLAVGRLTYQKDFSTLLRAFATVREKMDARLVILGDGPDRRNLESLATKLDIENHVDFPGYVDNPYPYLKRADLFVLSSRYEGLPNVLIEAQICGAPIVSTDCPTGPDEILMKGRAGVLVPVGDAASMAVAMSDVLCDQSLARGFVESGQEELHRFTPEACYNAYMRLIDGGTN